MLLTEPNPGKWEPTWEPKVMLALGADPWQARAWVALPEHLRVMAIVECLYITEPAGYA